MRAWLAETIYWITFIVIKQITFPHFWITFGGKLIFLLFLLFCHKRYYRNYILWFTYLFSLFPPRIKSWPWTGSGRVFSGSGSWPKHGAGFEKTWDIFRSSFTGQFCFVNCIIFKIIETLILNANMANIKQFFGSEKLRDFRETGPRRSVIVCCKVPDRNRFVPETRQK